MSELDLHSLRAALKKLLSLCYSKSTPDWIIKDINRVMNDIDHLEKSGYFTNPPGTNVSTEEI